MFVPRQDFTQLAQVLHNQIWLRATQLVERVVAREHGAGVNAAMFGRLDVVFHVTDEERVLGAEFVVRQNGVNLLPLVPDAGVWLIEKFIEDNLPKVGSEAEIPDSFEAFWEKERVAAFDQLVAEEDLDADKLKKVIDRYVYTGQAPLPDPDIAEIILKPMKLMERGPSKKRVFDRVVDYVATFIRGIAA